MNNMNSTPASERTHIAFFGCRNAGKSSLLNAVTGQDMAIVSDVLGTTTDPVYKTMELLPAGPVVIIDTPGIDDVGELGLQRVKKAFLVLRKTDVAVLVCDIQKGIGAAEKEIIKAFHENNTPYIIAFNKTDLTENTKEPKSENTIKVSALTGYHIWELKELIAKVARTGAPPRPLVGDLVEKGDLVVLVIPIDKAAPKGRLILPQQQVIRDLLDNGATPLIARDTELPEVIATYRDEIKMVVTDSQVFAKVADIVPDDIPMTSFSVLFSRYKGELSLQIKGIQSLKNLKDGDTVLIAEGCTHHRQCGDIGHDQIPQKLMAYTGKKLNFIFRSGNQFADETELKDIALVVHCGGCMLNAREMKARLALAEAAELPVTNYGILMAEFIGILNRATEVFRK